MVPKFEHNYHTVEQEVSASKIRLVVDNIDRGTIRSCSCKNGPVDKLVLHTDSEVVAKDDRKDMRQWFPSFEAKLIVFDSLNLVTLHHF